MIDIGDKDLVLESANLDHLVGDEGAGCALRQCGRYHHEVGASLRQPTDIFRKLHVVADQHAKLQAAEGDEYRRRRLGAEPLALIVAVEMGFAVDRVGADAIGEERAVVGKVAVLLREAGCNGKAVVAGDGCEPLGDFALGRRSEDRELLPCSVPRDSKLGCDQKLGAVVGSFSCRPCNASEIGLDFTSGRVHLQGCDLHLISFGAAGCHHCCLVYSVNVRRKCARSIFVCAELYASKDHQCDCHAVWDRRRVTAGVLFCITVNDAFQGASLEIVDAV